MPASTRFVVVGAGAIGGVVGGRLAQHGHDVVLVARGAHLERLQSAGLRIADPEREVTLRVPAVGHVADAGVSDDDVVLLCVKGQETAAALVALASCVPDSVPVACLQNGVDNERVALRMFERVYAVNVSVPAAFLVPGTVIAYCAPVTGILDLGRYPSGVDDTASALAAAFRSATFASEARDDIMPWKWSKLLINLTNAIEAICGPEARWGKLAEMVRSEALDCLGAAGIEPVSDHEERARRGDLLQIRTVGGRERPGGSSWQSLARGTGSIETDSLNGEIVLLGRLHDVPTPVNAHLQRVSREFARDSTPPGAMTEDEFLAGVRGRP